MATLEDKIDEVLKLLSPNHKSVSKSKIEMMERNNSKDDILKLKRSLKK